MGAAKTSPRAKSVLQQGDRDNNETFFPVIKLISDTERITGSRVIRDEVKRIILENRSKLDTIREGGNLDDTARYISDLEKSLLSDIALTKKRLKAHEHYKQSIIALDEARWIATLEEFRKMGDDFKRDTHQSSIDPDIYKTFREFSGSMEKCPDSMAKCLKAIFHAQHILASFGDVMDRKILRGAYWSVLRSKFFRAYFSAVRYAYEAWWGLVIFGIVIGIVKRYIPVPLISLVLIPIVVYLFQRHYLNPKIKKYIEAKKRDHFERLIIYFGLIRIITACGFQIIEHSTKELKILEDRLKKKYQKPNSVPGI